MGIVTDILRGARQSDRRLAKARGAFDDLAWDEKRVHAVEVLRVLEAGPAKPRRRARKAPAKPETIPERVTAVLAAHGPLNAAGVHAAIERDAPGVVSKGSVAAAVSNLLSRGLLVKAGSDGRSMAVALANGKGGGRDASRP